MKDIKIMGLRLENFKCHKSLSLDFGGGNASIYGDNATGKTSIYDALTWLLFAKDSHGNGEKNIEVKPLDASGNVKDHDALTSVEAVLLVNGEELTLRRSFREKWETRRGASEAVFTGNTSEYFIDGVPAKRNAFQDRVNELVDEDTFRLLTSVSRFAAGISWQDRRAMLFRVAGVMDDAQILATEARFQPLVEGMGKLSLEDYKRKLQAERKQYSVTKTELPARISECEKTITDIQGLDFAGAKAAVADLNIKLDSVNARMAAIQNDQAAKGKELELREERIKLAALESENRTYRDRQNTGVDTGALKAGVRTMETMLRGKRQQVETEKQRIMILDAEIGELRESWLRSNGEMFNGGNCPSCGQALPPERLKQALDAFGAEKQKRLDGILAQAEAKKQAKAAAAERAGDLENEIMLLEADIKTQKAAIEKAEADNKPIADMPDYAERQQAVLNRIEMLSGELYDLQSNSSAALGALRTEKAGIEELIRQQQHILGRESLLDYSRNRVKELREAAAQAAEKLDGIEQMLWLMDEYSRYKTRFVEDSINGRFRIARFRLFREQANGGIEDRCDVVHEGVPYISVNNGQRINLGIDIINTLSAAYGVRVPLFVDNAESVTHLEPAASQIIRLVVSKNDKELRISYEN